MRGGNLRRHGVVPALIGGVMCAGLIAGVVTPVWAAESEGAGPSWPAGGFAMGDGVEGMIDEQSGAVSFALEVGGVLLGWDSRLVGVNRHGFGHGWKVAGVSFVDVTGGVRVFPADRGVFPASASTSSGLEGYTQQDLRFEQVPGALPARADGLVGERAYAFRLIELGGTVSYFDDRGDPVARVDAFANRMDWIWRPGDTHRLRTVITDVGVVTELDWSDPSRVEVATRAGTGTARVSVVQLDGGRVAGVVDPVGGHTTVTHTDGLVSRLAGVSGAVTGFSWRGLPGGSAAVDRVRLIDAGSGAVLSERIWEPVAGSASGWPTVQDASASAAAGGYSTSVSDGATRIVSEYSDRRVLTGRRVLTSDGSGERLVQETAFSSPGDTGAGLPPQAGRPERVAVTHWNAAGASRVVEESFEFDPLGRLVVAHDGSRYTYDALNRSVAETTAAGEVIVAAFWASGQRKQLTSLDPETGAQRETRFYWDGSTLLTDTHTADAGADAASGGERAAASYLNGLMRHARTTTRSAGAGPAYYGHDRHGNVAELTDGAGAVTARHTYDDYGARPAQAGETEPQATATQTVTATPSAAALVGQVAYQPFGYSGEYTNPTGTQHLQVRTYDPDDRRFHQFDLADQLNPYWYGNANPITYVDPSGRQGELDWLGLAVAGIGLALSFAGVALAGIAAGTAMTAVGSWSAVLTTTKVALGVTMGLSLADAGLAAALAVNDFGPKLFDEKVALGLGVTATALGLAGVFVGGARLFGRATTFDELSQQNVRPEVLAAWSLRFNRDGSDRYWKATLDSSELLDFGNHRFVPAMSGEAGAVAGKDLIPADVNAILVRQSAAFGDLGAWDILNPRFEPGTTSTQLEFLRKDMGGFADTSHSNSLGAYSSKRGAKAIVIDDGVVDGTDGRSTILVLRADAGSTEMLGRHVKSVHAQGLHLRFRLPGGEQEKF